MSKVESPCGSIVAVCSQISGKLRKRSSVMSRGPMARKKKSMISLGFLAKSISVRCIVVSARLGFGSFAGCSASPIAVGASRTVLPGTGRYRISFMQESQMRRVWVI